MLMRQIFLFMVMLLVDSNVFAQGTNGRIVDEEGKPLAFANVMMLNSTDSTFVSGTISGEDGYFNLKVECKNQIVKVSLLGYKPIYINGQNDNLGTITLREDSKVLKDVVIKGNLPRYKSTSEGVQANVEGTVLCKMGTAEDVLSHIPGIVKKGNCYEVFGKGTPIIYVNKEKAARFI